MYTDEDPKALYPNCTVLTNEDAEKLGMNNQARGWGFSPADALTMIAKHMEAWFNVEDDQDVTNSMRIIEGIEWLFTDANFHGISDNLRKRKYKPAIKWVTDNMYFEEDGEEN